MKQYVLKLTGFVSDSILWAVFRLTARELRRQASKIRQSSSNLQSAITSLQSGPRKVMQPTLECAQEIVVEYDGLATMVEEMSHCDPSNLEFGKRLPDLRAKADRIDALRSHMQHVNEVFSRQVFDDAPTNVTKIVKPPGAWLVALTRIVFAPNACRRVFEPIIADMRSEYFEALSRGKRTEARIALLRGWIAIMRVLGTKALMLLSSLIWFRD